MLAATSRFSGCIWQGQKKTSKNALFLLWSLQEKNEKEIKRKERLRGSKKFMRYIQKNQCLKKRVRHD